MAQDIVLACLLSLDVAHFAMEENCQQILPNPHPTSSLNEPSHVFATYSSCGQFARAIFLEGKTIAPENKRV